MRKYQTIEIENVLYRAMLCDTFWKRMFGYMFFSPYNEERALLFELKTKRKPLFTTAYCPELDVFFLDENHDLLEKRVVPPSSVFRPAEKTRYVLEVRKTE